MRLQARQDGLQAEMVLLVDHHAERFIRIKQYAALALAFGQRRTNQVALHQQLALVGLQGVHLEKGRIAHRATLLRRTQDLCNDFLLVLKRGLRREGPRCEIAREAGATANDHAVGTPFAAEPASRIVHEILDIHGYFPSRTRMRSLS